MGVSLNDVAKDADAVDLDFDDVTILHVNWWLATITHTSWCSGGDHVARIQRSEFGDVGNNYRHRENQVRNRSLLHDLAVEARCQSKCAKLRDLIRGHQCRAESTRVGKVLAWSPLGGMTLPIAHTHIVVARVSCDVRAHGLFGDVTPPTTDHDREFPFVIERSREAWSQHRGSMPDLRISKPREDGWVLSLGPFCFRAMAYVIQTDAQDFLRVWNDRQKLHLIDLKSWDRLRVGTRQLAQRTGGQHRSQVAVTRSQTAANIDDAAIVQEPIATRAVSLKCDDFHYSRLRRRGRWDEDASSC